MPDLLLEPLPTIWAGRDIDPDFRPMVWLANAYARGVPDAHPLPFAEDACRRFYRGGVFGLQQLPDAYHALLDFYLGGGEEPTGSGSRSSGPDTIALDYKTDAPYIVAAFQQVYGIDLTTARVHWWRFKALLRGLPEDCLFSRILHWRTADLTELSPGERKRYEEMREVFALPPEVKGGARHAVTLAEHNEQFFDRFR